MVTTLSPAPTAPVSVQLGSAAALITAAGDSLQGTSAGRLERLGIGSAGQRKSVISSKEAWVTPASYSATGGSPTGTSDAATRHMAGLAGSITPTFSGRVLIVINGQCTATVASNGGLIQIRTGTGAAPANAAAVSGTAQGNEITIVSGILTYPFSISAIATGLSVGTAYWIDLSQLEAGGGGTFSMSNVWITAIEF